MVKNFKNKNIKCIPNNTENKKQKCREWEDNSVLNYRKERRQVKERNMGKGNQLYDEKSKINF